MAAGAARGERVAERRVARGLTTRTSLLALLALLAIGCLVATSGPRVVSRVAPVVHPGCLYDVRVGARGRALVALTIDDSPDPVGTPAILDTLRAYGGRATFFVITNQIPEAGPVMERIRREGHEIGNHFTSDRPTILLDSITFEADLARADSALRPFGPVRWARPGSGWYTARMVRSMKRAGYRCALGTVYPMDGSLGWPWFSTRFVLAHARPGSVIVLHDRGERARRTAQVLGSVLREFRARGYEVVTLSELVGE